MTNLQNTGLLSHDGFRWRLIAFICVCAALLITSSVIYPSTSFAQNVGLFPDEIAVDEGADDAAIEAAPDVDAKPSLSLWGLLLKGRWLMVPIVVMSVVVVMLGIERGLATRRARVLPDELVEGLTNVGGVPGAMDPRRAYRLCQQHPSPAATVIRSMLLKIGRPHTEVERAVTETSEREAERLYGNVRWLNLIAAIAPLTGLLGTVWGMIRAFYETTQIPVGHNKAEYLAQGIYVALVTTLGGLVVAIPAAIFAHYYEGRVIKLFHEVDELLFSLMPQIERYEGRMRVTPHSLSGTDDPGTPMDAGPAPPDGPKRRNPTTVRQRG